MARPALSEFLALAAEGTYARAPVSTEIMADFITPIEVMRKMKNISNHCYMLESAFAQDRWGRYTFLGFDPVLEITCMNGEMKIGALHMKTRDPGRYLRRILAEYRSPKFDYLPPFAGGLVGYFSYDYLKYAEPTLDLDAEDVERFKDVDLMLFDKVIAFDNFRQKIVLIVNADLKAGEAGYRKAERELILLEDLIRRGKPGEDEAGRLTSPVRQLFSREEFTQMVERARHYIREGDIFQIVLSNRLEADFEGSLLNTYRILRTLNPSPYMFYFSGTDVEVAGASPETLVKLEDGVLHTFPLAGTRPRGKTVEEDLALEKELLADPKELAEHNMLVDLGRNDIGKISRFGTVKVETHEVLRYSHVMHIGSTVSGKIRACQLINELENNKRGIYGGAIGYIDFSGNMDTCIAIRIAYKKNGKVFIRSGAGIVADSVPEKEYEECINKAAAVVAALREGTTLTETERRRS